MWVVTTCGDFYPTRITTRFVCYATILFGHNFFPFREVFGGKWSNNTLKHVGFLFALVAAQNYMQKPELSFGQYFHSFTKINDKRILETGAES